MDANRRLQGRNGAHGSPLDSLYDALKAAGAPEEQARAAARDVAGYGQPSQSSRAGPEHPKWMVGVVIGDAAGHVLDAGRQVVDRLAGIEARLPQIESSCCRMHHAGCRASASSAADHSVTNKPLVAFTPSGRRGRFPRGTPLLQAARELGVDVDRCAAAGRCAAAARSPVRGRVRQARHQLARRAHLAAEPDRGALPGAQPEDGPQAPAVLPDAAAG